MKMQGQDYSIEQRCKVYNSEYIYMDFRPYSESKSNGLGFDKGWWRKVLTSRKSGLFPGA